MRTPSLRGKRRGISTYIAVLLLIILAIAAGLLIYAYTMGWLGSITGVHTSGRAIQIQGNPVKSANQYWIYVKNIGTGSVTLDPSGSSRLYVNDLSIPFGISESDLTKSLPEGKTCTLTLNISDLDVSMSGKSSKIKIQAEDGTFTEGLFLLDYLNSYTISASVGAGGGGAISPTGSVVVNAGATQVFIITPNPGYHTVDVVVDGISVGAVGTYTFSNVQASHAIVATFAVNGGVTHTVTVTQGAHGTIVPFGTITVYDGVTLVFTITPDSGYHTENVLVDGASKGIVPSYTLSNIQADHTITASFALGPAGTFTITASVGAGGGGTINPSGSIVVNAGATQVFTITPNSGYHTVDVVVDSVSQGAIGTYTFSNVQASHTIIATFAANTGHTYTITASVGAGGGGTISPSGSVVVNEGATQVFYITPFSGYHTVDVVVDGVSQGAVGTYTFSNVQASHTIVATFAANTGITFTITASVGAGGGGTINPSGSIVVNAGATQVFTITPNSGYHTVDVVVDSVSQGAIGTYTFSNVQASHTIIATFAANTGSTYAITVTQGAHGTISPSGIITVYNGVTLVFTITPDSGYHISDVLVDGASKGAVSSYTFSNIQANHVITATFALTTGPTYTITASAGSGGSISPSGAVLVNQGATQVFTINANAGYHTVDVLVDGNSVGAVGTYTFTNVQASHSISASFTVNTGSTHTIIASAGTGGTISPSGNVVVNNGATQVFTITPNTGNHIVDVLVDGGTVGAVGTYTFNNVQTDHTISATFAVGSGTAYTITATAGSGGSITPSGQVIVYQGSSQLFTITPTSGYHIVDVVVDTVSQGAIGSYTFTNVQGNHAISATFDVNNGVAYTIQASAGTGGTITPSGNIIVNQGATQVFTITPDFGFYIANVVVDGVSQGAIARYTFANVQANHAIVASFVANNGVALTIVASAGTGGTITPSGNVVVNYGATQVFTITSDNGYYIANVVVDGVSQGAISSYTFSNVQANHNIAASFTPNTQVYFTLTTSAGPGGSITPPGPLVVPQGVTQVFTITPSTGYNILDVQVDHVSQGAIGRYVFNNIQADHLISATFGTSTGTYTITASVSGTGGTITPSGNVAVSQGATQVFSIAANTGYNIANVLVDGVSQGAVTTYTFNNVQASHTIVASFVPVGATFTITASAGTGGTITPTGSVIVNQGATQVFTITPNSGYYIVGVTVDGASQGAIGSYTFSNVQSNHNIAATFAPNTGNSLVFIAGISQTLSTGSLSTVITVQRTGGSGSFTINLATTSVSGGAFQLADGSPVNQITVSGSQTSFYYKDTLPGTPTLTVSATGYNPAQTTFTITGKAVANIATALSPINGILVGGQVTDSATLVSVTTDASGTFTYNLYRGVYPSGTLVDSSTHTVTNGVVPSSKTFTASQSGSYYIRSVYSGDSKNNGLTSQPEEFVAWPSAQTILLRPNSDSSDLHHSIYPTSPTTHYTHVNEASPDGDTSYTYAVLNHWTDDNYGLTDSSVSTGTINYITLHMVARTTGNGLLQASVTTHSIDYQTNNPPFPLTTSYIDYTTVFTTNPNTNAAWTWSEINALQVGVMLYRTYGEARVTQVYVEVTYTP